jgi:hypothetical protein
MAGYSGTPLAKKLGIEAGDRVTLIAAPEGFNDELAPLPDDVVLTTRLTPKPAVVLAFFTRRTALEKRLRAMEDAVRPAGSLWIAWPKRSSGVATDIDENLLREVILPTGFVDNKVCAVTEVWSGLRFVLRRELR